VDKLFLASPRIGCIKARMGIADESGGGKRAYFLGIAGAGMSA
jgi:hypothetical protein